MKKIVQIVCAALLLLAGAGSVLADGGVTFTNIAADDGAGITYRRVTSPDRQADRDAIVATSIPIPDLPMFQAESPQKWHASRNVTS